MAETLRDFIVSYGFAVDDSSRSRAESATKAAEDRITAANAAALAKRLSAEKTAQTERIRAAIAAGEQLTADDRRFVLEQEKNRVSAADAEKRRQQDESKRCKAQREETLKEIRATALKVTGVVTGIAAAVQGAAGGILYATDRAAKAFERLNYAGQASGTTASGINAFSYAIQQLGGTAEAAQASLSAFGSNLQKYEAFEGVLKSMGIVTRDTNGHLRDSSSLLTEYLQKLRDMPRAQREAVAGAWGIDESTVQAGIRPELRSRIAEYNRDQGAIGSDPNSAAAGGTAFQQSMRHVTDLIDAIRTKIADTLFRIIGPQLDQVADWLRENGKTVSDVITALAGGISRLEAALISAIAGNGTFKDAMAKVARGLEDFGNYIGSDDFRKDVKGFVADIIALAKAVRHGLELLGILPTSPVDRASAAGADGIEANNMGVFGNAIVRGHKNMFGGRQDQTDEGKVRSRLDGFRKGGNYGEKNWWTPERESHAVDVLMKEAGLTEDGAKALVSRWKYVESPGGPTAVNPISGAAGIAQGLGSRRSGYTGSFDEQLLNAAKELNGAESRAKRMLNTPGQEPAGASQFERAEGYDASTGRDNFTDRTAGGMAHVHHGTAGTVYVNGVPSSDGPTGTGSGGGTADSQSADSKPPAMSDAEVGQFVKDFHNGKPSSTSGSPAPKTTNDGGWRTTDWRGGAPAKPHDAAHDNYEKRTFGRYLHAAKKLAGQGDFANPLSPERKILADAMRADDARRHQRNMMIVQAAKEGRLSPYMHHRPLGDTEAMRSTVHKSIKGDTHVTHNPNFTIHTSDAKAGMEAARMVADRGNRDLIRNVQGMEA